MTIFRALLGTSRNADLIIWDTMHPRTDFSCDKRLLLPGVTIEGKVEGL